MCAWISRASTCEHERQEIKYERGRKLSTNKLSITKTGQQYTGFIAHKRDMANRPCIPVHVLPYREDHNKISSRFSPHCDYSAFVMVQAHYDELRLCGTNRYGRQNAHCEAASSPYTRLKRTFLFPVLSSSSSVILTVTFSNSSMLLFTSPLMLRT
jgi:hypothetical protein